MKVSYLVIVLLYSDITFTSGDDFPEIIVHGYIAATTCVLLAIVYAVSSGPDNVLPFHPEHLHRDLNENLYGQRIVSEVVLNAVTSFMFKTNPNKPLVLSFHGTTGVGKNHVAKIIARNIYKKGDKSNHYITFLSEHHFPHKDNVDIYSAQLKQQIHHQVLNFPLSMFVFDEMDKMNPELLKALTPLLGYTHHVNGMLFHKAIFIFLSNEGGNVIANTALDFWRTGKDREEIQMNSKGMETQSYLNIFNDKSSGFWELVDHFIPFLPLERKHIRQCVLSEMASLKISVQHHPDLADTVVKEMSYFPSDEKIFSIKGCKSVRQKLMLHIND